MDLHFLMSACLVLLLRQCSYSAKIIMKSPQFGSHILQQVELGSELVHKGHEVYVAVASRYPKPETLINMGLKVLFYRMPDDVMYGVSQEYESFLRDTIFEGGVDMPVTSSLTISDCNFMMEDQNFLDAVRNLHCDLAIVEPFVLSPCNLLLPKYLKIPFVLLMAGILPWQSRIPALPSFFPVLNPFQRFDETSILGRIENLLAYVIVETGVLFPGVRNTSLLERFAPELTSWGELVRESELYLVLKDHNLANAIPSLPHVVTIAGLTCLPPKKLEPDIETVMSGNKHGVILLSFGSMTYQVPKDVILKFFSAFSKLNETVIAKLPSPEDGEVPKNVKLMQWLPQNDILGHSNTKLFITHCGNGGQHEALYHGVPMIGFPLYAEQTKNCQNAHGRGFQLTMNIRQFTSDELYRNIVEVLNNPKYKQNIKRASEIFRDQPMSAREKAIFWIEHVIKYGGNHLRSVSLNQPLYEFLMLDVLAILFILFYILITFAKAVLKMLVCTMFRSKEKNEKLKLQ